MNILMDLIIPEEEILEEIPQEATAIPAVLAVIVAVFAAVLIIKAVRKKK